MSLNSRSCLVTIVLHLFVCLWSKAQIQVIEVLQRVCISRVSVPFARRAALHVYLNFFF